MSVNVSGRQLGGDRPGRGRRRRAARKRASRPSPCGSRSPRGTIMRDPERMPAALDELEELGVGAHLDDFGTGYSSLTFLRHFSGDTLKIDRSFIASMQRRRRQRRDRAHDHRPGAQPRSHRDRRRGRDGGAAAQALRVRTVGMRRGSCSPSRWTRTKPSRCWRPGSRPRSPPSPPDPVSPSVGELRSTEERNSTSGERYAQTARPGSSTGGAVPL